MLPIVQEACDAFILGSPEFWLIAGAMDVSFEAGSNARFRHQIDILSSCGCPATAVARLLDGVNGNIARLIEAQHPELGPFHANAGRNGHFRPDVWFGIPNSLGETVVEIKAIYEMTMPKFYSLAGSHCVADDRAKLMAIRQAEQDFIGNLIQLVFFLELPNYDYPAGESLHRQGWKRHKPRKHYRRFETIEQQFEELRKYLPPPTFPSCDAPNVSVVPPPTLEIAEALRRWCEKTYRPDEQWCLQVEHMTGVRVGYAIWEC